MTGWGLRAASLGTTSGGKAGASSVALGESLHPSALVCKQVTRARPSHSSRSLSPRHEGPSAGPTGNAALAVNPLFRCLTNPPNSQGCCLAIWVELSHTVLCRRWLGSPVRELSINDLTAVDR